MDSGLLWGTSLIYTFRVAQESLDTTLLFSSLRVSSDLCATPYTADKSLRSQGLKKCVIDMDYQTTRMTPILNNMVRTTSNRPPEIITDKFTTLWR